MNTHKPVLCLDTEIFKDYYLAAFRNIQTGNVRTFEMWPGQDFDCATVARILQRHTVVTFNGNGFDMPLLSMAVAGAKCEKIKAACDSIIQNNMRSWQLERKYLFETIDCDHIDLIEVAPGMVSLKIYGGRMHLKRMQDLPIEPSASITPEDRVALLDYCVNSDLPTTEALYRRLLPQIELRERMSEQYGMDLRSKSDAQIAEAVIKSEVEKITDRIVERPKITEGTEYRYSPPKYIQFANPELQNILSNIVADTFIVSGTGKVADPKSLKNTAVTIGATTYTMGIGGLHSTEHCVAHHATDDVLLLDRDVEGYYPNLIRTLGLAPAHMGGPFNKVYASILSRRSKAKHSGDTVTANALKIVCNASYGKFGSMWSVLYAPKLLIQTTVTGQLALLMLIEMLEASGTSVVSANTDGVVLKFHKSEMDAVNDVIYEWETLTQLTTEETRYRAVYSKDVNNYIAIKPDGSHKAKGIYAGTGLAKTPSTTVCMDAVLAFLKHGTPVEDTIHGCWDITRFVSVRTVRGGALDQAGNFLGKAVRWYYGIGVSGGFSYKTNGYLVPRTEGAMPCMNLPDEFPENLDLDWYITEAKSILTDIGATNA